MSSPTADISAQAQGGFIIVSLSVKNIGDQQETYMAINQKLIIDGKQYTYAGQPTFTLSDNATSQINPSIGIDTEVVFDVPVGAQPSSIELHSEMNSAGVYVTLAA